MCTFIFFLGLKVGLLKNKCEHLKPPLSDPPHSVKGVNVAAFFYLPVPSGIVGVQPSAARPM